MKNKTYYQKTFSRLTASDALIQEVLDMDQKKVYRSTKKVAGLAVAAAMMLAATGAAYAATDGDLSQFWERITLYINGKEADPGQYDIVTDENGNQTLIIPESDVSYSFTANPNTVLDPNHHYLIDIDTTALSDQAEDIPFTLEADGNRLYLVEENGSRIDITEAAASEEGYIYTWKDADGTLRQAIALGTPEEHFISFGAGYQFDSEENAEVPQ